MNLSGMKLLSLNVNNKELETIKALAQDLSLEIASFTQQEEALQACQSVRFDAAVVDSLSVDSDICDFIRTFRHTVSKEMPLIVLLNALDTQELQAKALHLGAFDFLPKPLHASLFQARIFHALELKKSQALLADQNYLVEDAVNTALEVSKNNVTEYFELVSLALEGKDYKNSKHTLRIAHYSKLLAKAAGLSERIVDTVFHASQLHDLGKLDIPDAILLKEDQLDDNEFEIVKRHARFGYDRLKYAQSPYLKAAAVICYSHHEKYDGSGYPIGLVGETIPLPGRIVAIADTFDALTSQRPYRKAHSVDAAVELLKREKGKQFDPQLVDLFIDNIDKVEVLKKELSDDNVG